MKNQTKELVLACIKELKGISETLSGDDSGLKNCWEEICIQVQDEYSYMWEVYLSTIDSTIEYCIKKAGYNYSIDFNVEATDVDEVDELEQESEIDDIDQQSDTDEYKTRIRDLVLQKAADYSNVSIRKYLDR